MSKYFNGDKLSNYEDSPITHVYNGNLNECHKVIAVKDDASQCTTINGVKFSYEQMSIIQEVIDDYRMKIKNLNQQLKSQQEIVDDIKKRLAKLRTKMQNDVHCYPQTVVCWQDIVEILDQAKGDVGE